MMKIRNVPKMLRELASQIDRGEARVDSMAAVAWDGEKIHVYGWGAFEAFEHPDFMGYHTGHESEIVYLLREGLEHLGIKQDESE
jgi:hypothetical protein